MYCIFLYLMVVVLNSGKEETAGEGCAVKTKKTPIAIAGPDKVITLPPDSISLDDNAPN